MSEGTKLGELKNNYEFNAAVAPEGSLPSSELRGTKIGDMSDFEKELYTETKDVQVALVEEDENELFLKIVEDTSFEDALKDTVVDYQVGDIVKGSVRSVEKAGILVDIRYKSDGFIPNAEFGNDPNESPSDLKPGDPVDALIDKLETKEGYTILSRKKAEYEIAWNHIFNLSKSRETLDVAVVSKVEGGLVADYKGIKGFIPASQVLKNSEDSLDSFLNQVLSVSVLQSDRKRRKVIFSHKAARYKQKENIGAILDAIEIGGVRHGKVSSIKSFGVFVDIGGVEGLVHISELSWARVNHPSELLNVGDEVDVFILGVDKEHGKVSLGMKQLSPDPWVKVAEKYKVGQIVSGTITRLVSFGAFIQLERDLEGLIHISELSTSRVEKSEDVLEIGQVVQAKIIKLIPDEQRIGLSLKALQQNESSSVNSEQNDADLS